MIDYSNPDDRREEEYEEQEEECERGEFREFPGRPGCRHGRMDPPEGHCHRHAPQGFDEGPHGCRHGEWGRGPMEPMPFPADSDDGLTVRFKLLSDRLMRDGGQMRGQEKILEILSARGQMSQRDLVMLMHIKPGSMSEILAKLENKGFIERIPYEDDRRMMTVKLTEKGSEHAKEVQSGKKDGIYDALSEEEKKTLAGLLDKLIDSFDREKQG